MLAFRAIVIVETARFAMKQNTLMDADTIIKAVQAELQRHTFDTFMDEPPSNVRGGRGVVISGCPACKKPLQSVAQFMHHLVEDVLPATIRHAVTE
jgi:hypothetical protein